MFAEVAKQGSFTLAAKQIGMSKSALSQQLKRLEQNIGQQLLSRNTRGMSLTAAGEKLLARSELLQDQVNLAFEELSSSKEAPSGVFALTIPHSCEKDIVLPALQQLCLEFPLIEPRVLVSDEPKDLIQENMDLAIYAGELKDSNYRALPIGTAREIICASPAYLMKRPTIQSVESLGEHRWIPAPWQNTTLSLYSEGGHTEKTDVEVKAFASANTLPCAIELVLRDMGIALLPEFVVQPHVNSGQLLRVLPDREGRQWPFYMVHRFQQEKPIHITRFYQLLKHFFAKATIA
mgnify:CR=1 FL=1